MSELTDLIIRNATILHPDGHLQQGDVAIAEEKIQEVASQVTQHASLAFSSGQLAIT